MKLKILKLCTMLFFFLFIGVGCQKDDWENIELNNNSCANTGNDFVEYIQDFEGIITNYGSGSEYFIIVEGLECCDQQSPLFACNLPIENIYNEQKIIFSGELKSWQITSNDSITADYFSIPIKLTQAKIKNR